MGKDAARPLTELFNAIEEIYTQRKMYLNIGIMKLNLPDANADNIMIVCTALLKRLLCEDQLLREEQLRYFESLVEFLMESKQIAPVTVIIIEREFSAIIEYYSLEVHKNTAWEKAKIDFQQLRNKLYFLSVDFLNKLNDWRTSDLTGEAAVLKMTYRRKPIISLASLLNDPALGLPEPVILLKEAEGCWLEWIQVPDHVITCIGLLLQFLGVVAVPVILDKRKEKRAAKEKKEQELTARQAQNKQQSLITVYVNQGLSTEIGKDIPGIVNVIIQSNLLKTPQRGGYCSENVEKIELIQSP